MDIRTDGIRYSLEDLRGIIETLRSDTGCPWDRKQTHVSLKGCMMEEAREVLEGIDLYERPGSGTTCARSWAMCFCRW